MLISNPIISVQSIKNGTNKIAHFSTTFRRQQIYIYRIKQILFLWGIPKMVYNLRNVVLMGP